MTKKERIAELERRVNELEAMLAKPVFVPTSWPDWSTYRPYHSILCPICGQQGMHVCPARGMTTTAATTFSEVFANEDY